MHAGKPIIGIAGGIGSGKSFVASLFREAGCHVIDSDAQVRAAYDDPQIKQTIRSWWGPQALKPDGSVDRAWIANKVFSDPIERQKLEELLHPKVLAARVAEMEKVAREPNVLAFVWDAPLLFEAGLRQLCDVVVFVDSPWETRLQRVSQTRGWGAEELARRENSQWPLDKKHELSDYTVTNAADAAPVRDQVRELLPRILAKFDLG
ncbi:MAG TPA: dephospho-CoA kinase [Humisphaera sp.]|jgi:dephospho-CoA kinase|nr:dephospho-CoA kinase [Humisphaera sp.]